MAEVSSWAARAHAAGPFWTATSQAFTWLRTSAVTVPEYMTAKAWRTGRTRGQVEFVVSVANCVQLPVPYAPLRTCTTSAGEVSGGSAMV